MMSLVSRATLREFLVRDVAALAERDRRPPSTSITEMRANAVAVEPGSRPVTRRVSAWSMRRPSGPRDETGLGLAHRGLISRVVNVSR